MKKKLLILLGAALLLSGCSLPSFLQKKAGLKVNITDSAPASISLDGKDVGQAPYASDNLSPGSYTIKLTPQDAAKPAYETTITLNAGSVTQMNWSFGATLDESSGDVFELTPTSGGKTELSIVTNPDNIIVKVDGESKGFSPLILSDLPEGTHTLTLSAPGYVERTSSPSLKKGTRNTVTSKLGREPETSALSPTPSASPSASLAPMPTPAPTATPKASPKVTPTASPKTSPGTSPVPSPSASPTTGGTDSPDVIKTTTTPATPYAEIKSPDLGYVNVRATGEQSGTLLAKLGDGSKVPYIDKNDAGWLKVEYQTGKQGWISGAYATVHN